MTAPATLSKAKRLAIADELDSIVDTMTEATKVLDRIVKRLEAGEYREQLATTD
jgi:hypothetical protein